MLRKFGTLKELETARLSLPKYVMTELTRDLAILDCEYGAERNWHESGGYSAIIETSDDLDELVKIVDYRYHPCEWATRLGEDSGWLSALFLFGDDYALMAFMPIDVAPDTILEDLED